MAKKLKTGKTVKTSTGDEYSNAYLVVDSFKSVKGQNKFTSIQISVWKDKNTRELGKANNGLKPIQSWSIKVQDVFFESFAECYIFLNSKEFEIWEDEI